MEPLHLHSYSYSDRDGILPHLTDACIDSGAWVLDRRTVSASTIEISLEVQLDAIVELYSGLIGSGLELSRAAHAALTDLCLCRHHHQTLSALFQVITIRLEISFLETLTLHSLLTTATCVA